MRKIVLTFLILLVSNASFSQAKYTSQEININKLIEGTLLFDEQEQPQTLAIIIQGSGPTDRDGNQPMMKNNSLKYLAEGISNNDIATFRYDKRLVKLALSGRLVEKNISFDDFIEDASQVVTHFQNDPRFDKIIIIGHSQGSLVGMLAAYRNQVDGYISIAGTGQTIDKVIVEQLKRQAPALAEDAERSFKELKLTGEATNYGIGLISIFRPNIQPFMKSWMQYNPQTEIAKLTVPILILNGTEDIQVNPEEAKLLHKASPLANFQLIDSMNHVFKKIEPEDTMDNAKSYNEPQRPIMNALVEKIVDFIKTIND